MAQYKDVIVNAGAGGFGGPLVLKPDDKKNKVLTSEYVTDDGLMIETIMNASDDIKRRVIAYYYLICDKDNSDKQG